MLLAATLLEIIQPNHDNKSTLGMKVVALFSPIRARSLVDDNTVLCTSPPTTAPLPLNIEEPPTITCRDAPRIDNPSLNCQLW